MAAEDATPNVIPIASARLSSPAWPFGSEPLEIEVADRFVTRARGTLVYCRELGGYLTFSGAHWEPDDRERARELAKEIVREIGQEAGMLLDAPLFRAAKRYATARGIRAILELARSSDQLVLRPQDFDQNPWALNVLNGTIDLKTGSLRPHQSSEHITRVCPVVFDPQAQAPRFERFLEEIQPDRDVRAYLARFLGYAASGSVAEQALAIWHGRGGNGKSVFAEAVATVLGGYARPAPNTLLIQHRNHSPHPTDLAACRGARLLLVHETERGGGFDASRLKLLTGGDRLTARYMRQDFFEFVPTHTIIMLTNHPPAADGRDEALWRRIQLVPFEATFTAQQRQKDLPQRLREEQPGILRWIIEGALAYQRHGLAPPQVVLRQTEAYRRAEDSVGRFLETCVVVCAGSRVGARALYERYVQWAEHSASKCVSNNLFAAELEALGREKTENSKGRFYLNVAIRDDSA